MIAWKWLALVVQSDHRLPRQHVGQRNIRRIPVVAMRQDEVGWPLNPCCRKDVLDEHALPCSIELGPGRHTVNVFGHLRFRQGVELAPIPDLNGSRADLDRELPVGGFHVRGRSGREDREILDEVLAWGGATGLVAARAAAGAPDS